MDQRDNKHCCVALAETLGRGRFYPKPAYISVEDWRGRGRLDWWYPGATGPGYYWIDELDEMEDVTTPVGVFRCHKITFRPMEECPYCGADLRGRR